MYGYVDRDGDGWRETPDGKPLTLAYASQPEQIYRQYNDLVRRGLTDIGCASNSRSSSGHRS
jgi:hypothetical protein